MSIRNQEICDMWLLILDIIGPAWSWTTTIRRLFGTHNLTNFQRFHNATFANSTPRIAPSYLSRGQIQRSLFGLQRGHWRISVAEWSKECTFNHQTNSTTYSCCRNTQWHIPRTSTHVQFIPPQITVGKDLRAHISIKNIIEESTTLFHTTSSLESDPFRCRNVWKYLRDRAFCSNTASEHYHRAVSFPRHVLFWHFCHVIRRTRNNVRLQMAKRRRHRTVELAVGTLR